MDTHLNQERQQSKDDGDSKVSDDIYFDRARDEEFEEDLRRRVEDDRCSMGSEVSETDMVTSKSTWNETDEERRGRIQREAELDRINDEREIQRRQLPFKILESLNAINTKLELLLEIAKNDR